VVRVYIGFREWVLGIRGYPTDKLVGENKEISYGLIRGLKLRASSLES
jgi:hypothetical protein